MRSLSRLAAIVAAGVLSCLPLAAQTMVKDSALPAAGTLTGTEGLRAVQGSGCPTSVSPCANVRVTPVQLASYMTSTGQFQASDVDLTAIAALATQGYGRTLLTMPDAPTTRAYLGLGSNALDSTPRAPAVRLINTTAPLTGGGDLSADRTLGISLATGVSAGAMSAGDKGKLDSVNVGASVSSVACTGAGGISCSVTSGTTAAQLTIAPGALTPTSVAATGTVTGSNLSGTNTGDQTSVSGNAGTATKLATARTLSVTGDTSWTLTFDGSGNATGTSALASTGVTAGTYGSAAAVVVPTIDAKGRITAIATAPLGTAATANTGTSGANLGLLNTANTVSATETHTAPLLTAASVAGAAGLNIPTGTAPTTPNAGDLWLASGVLNLYAGGATNTLAFLSSSITGNAATATALQTPRKINGVTFGGTNDITVNAVDSTPRAALAGAAFAGPVSVAGSGTPFTINSTNSTLNKITLQDNGTTVAYLAAAGGTPFQAQDASGNTLLSINSSRVATFGGQVLSGPTVASSSGTGSTTSVSIDHPGGFSAAATENRLDFTQSSAILGRIASYYDGGSGWGINFYPYSSGLSATPALTITPAGTVTAGTPATGTATTQVATTAFADALKDLPQTSLSANYTLALSDRGKHIYYGANSGNTLTVPPNSSVPFPIGTRIIVVNFGGGNQTITYSGSAQVSSSSGVKSYTLSSGNVATLLKVGTDLWVIFGNGLS